jgi:hypothetical protein
MLDAQLNQAIVAHPHTRSRAKVRPQIAIMPQLACYGQRIALRRDLAIVL